MRMREILRRSEILPPVTVAHERDRRRSLVVVTGRKIPTDHRLNAEYSEKLRRYGRNYSARGLLRSGNRNSIGRVLCDGLKTMALIAKIVKVRIREARE